MSAARTLMLSVLASILSAGGVRAGAIAASSADAFVNLGTGPYAAANDLTTGNAGAWYNSSDVARIFGGTPNAQQRADFDAQILNRVEQTFSLAGVRVSLTDDPSVAAGHSLSVVSNASSAYFPDSIGTTDLGGDGFTFIDPIAKSAQSLDQLEWIVAHNVAHELMLAFGVGENYDKSGAYIDARNASGAMMIDPKATFSRDAAQALLAADFSQVGSYPPGVIMNAPQTVPEPATVLLWSAVVVGGITAGRRRSARGR